ncbi:AAA family ATPase [Sansalvadorimonas sp. 2012CJ34-2]|uniref:AAA family ATPase n=1 Tax=Parendozoicomonas callyspongiae TaxID=2942213 RepID=A0ABT0PG57_9GAMM|nr:AAA family ATPase [Sansalvadorimonas sp. 2012CJ34-2]MCL6270344.1 AAA family ATPase [Sansalvadorimonas sp. 2012CJ34-2]
MSDFQNKEEPVSSQKTHQDGKRKAVKHQSEPALKRLALESQEGHPSQHFSEDAVFFIEDDTQRQQVLENCRQMNHGPVITLRSPADLEHHNLLHTITCDEKGVCHQTAGRLFSEQPLTLVLDLTLMSPGQIASLNDLLERPKRLGKQVRLVALVSPAMLEPGPDKPGPDCWRRLQAFPALFPAEVFSKSLADRAVPVKSNDALLQERVQKHALAEQQAPLQALPEVIDFADRDAWRTRLFGGLALNDRGKLYFKAGQLHGLEEHQAVILQDAPWDNPDFTAALATTLREGGFEANGAWVSLPDSLRWFRQDTDPEALESLRQQFAQKGTAKGADLYPTVYLNAASLEDALRDTQIHKGIIHSADTLEQLLSGAGTLCLTQPLNNTQWLRLLRRLERLKQPPRLIDLTQNNQGFEPALQPDRRCQRYRHETVALAQLDETHKTCRVTAQTQWESLWQDTQLVSQNKMFFETRDTPLLTALKQGKPIAFHGLETAPELMAKLESLLAQPPYLLVNGQKIQLPHAKVTFLWPEQATPPASPLWQHALQQAPVPCSADNPCPWMMVLDNLPFPTRKSYPAKLPWQGQDFDTLLYRQVEQERIEDGAQQVLPVHHRKALHTLLAKAYRGDNEVYGYLKYQIRQHHPDDPPQTAADRNALQQWLDQHPRISRRVLEQHFWSLARYCPVSAFSQLLPNGFNTPDESALDQLARYLVGAAEPQQRKALAQSLGVAPEVTSSLQYYRGTRRTRLRDALLAAGFQRKGSEAVSEQVRSLDQRIDQIIRQNEDQQQAIDKTKEALGDYFPKDLLQDDFSDLAEALVQGSRGQRHRQQRRMRRLTERVRRHPLVFLQGEAGAGKSHMARAVAEQLRQAPDQNSPPSQVLSLGPETSAEQLFGQAVIEDIRDDATTTFKPGPILRWAMSGNPPLLVLDEANLAREGVLAPLAGLMETPPRISYQGKDYVLSDRHRVILTGNPVHYSGRHMDSTLKKHLLTLYYRPLDQDMLAEFIIRPALPAHWPDGLKDRGVQTILSLYRQYGKLLPDALSPRDLQDVLCRISQTLRHHQQAPEGEEPMETDAVLSPESLHQVVFDAFSGSLAGRIPADNRERLHALEHWYTAHFPCDKSLTQSKQSAFQSFLEQLRNNNPDVDLHSAPVVQLVQHYWQFLDQQRDQPRGRRSLLVEGPAGWGKDLILKRVLTLWEQQSLAPAPFVHINANPDQWDALKETTQTAMAQGQKLVISELNLLPSRFLEGLFNEVLTSSTAHPEFVLIATVNPASFGGRETLSTALKSRCTEVQLTPLSEPDLRGMLVRRTENDSLPGWLSIRYQSLLESLRLQHAPIQLSLDDLFRAADILNQTPKNDWPQAFKTTFGLALQSVGLTMEALEQRLAESTVAMDDGRNERSERLSRHLNTEQPEPLTIRLLTPDANPAWYADRLTLHLPDISDEVELLDMARSILAFFQQPETESIISGPLGGNITTHKHYEIRKFFAGNQFATNDYRLSLRQLVMQDDQLREVTLSCDHGEVESIQSPGWPKTRLRLTGMQQLGGGYFVLKQSRWTPLPGLSAVDQLLHLRCTPSQPLGTARHKETGQLLVRLADNASVQSARMHLAFIIEPDQDYFAPLQGGEPIETVDALLPPQVRERLDKELFSLNGRVHPAFCELQDIKDIPDKASQLNALAQWCKTFRADHDVPGEGLNLLLNLMREKQGVCRHRSQVFQVLSQYFGVPARMVSNVAHRYVEFSPDRGCHWRKIDLGGGGESSSNERSQHHPVNIVLSERVELTARTGHFAGKSVDTTIHRLFQKGQEQQEYSELVDFLKNKPPTNVFHEVYYFAVKQDSRVSTLNPPWLDILTHWHRQTLAESSADKQAEMQKRLGKGALNVMAAFYYHWLLGEIPDSKYVETLKQYLPLVQQGIVPTGAALQILESLADHKIQEAEQLLEAHYQQLTQSQIWPAALKQELMKERLKPLPDLGGHSPTLARALQRTDIDTQWSRVATGAPPSLERMVRKQPSFPLSRKTSLMRPVYFVLSEKLMLMRIPGHLESELSRLEQEATRGLFFNWLLEQDATVEWRTLLNNIRVTNSAQCLTDGCYPSVRLLDDEAKAFLPIDTCTNYSNVAICTDDLNPLRIKKAFNDPEALVLDVDFLATCFKEFLDTMDTSQLKTFVRALQTGAGNYD